MFDRIAVEGRDDERQVLVAIAHGDASERQRRGTLHVFDLAVKRGEKYLLQFRVRGQVC